MILCIGDATIALRVRKPLLTEKGHNVLMASSGEQALEVFKQNSVDLVIADHFRTDKTGTEIAREMKELKPGVPSLILSAAAEKPAGRQFVDGFLEKGELPEVMLDTIARLLAEFQ
jgi:CheY-like chemotaxis protein